MAGEKAAKLSSYWEALGYYEKAMEKMGSLSDDQHKKQLTIDLVIKRSQTRHMLGALRPDLEELERYVNWAEELGNEEKLSFFYSWLGSHYRWMEEEFEKAAKYTVKEISTSDEEALKHIYGNLGERLAIVSYVARGEYELAIFLGRQIAEAAKREGDVLSLRYFCNTSARLARVYRIMGRWQEGLTACREMLEVAISISHSTHIIQAHAELGNTYVCMGEWEKAISECEIALGMSPSAFPMPWIIQPLGYAYCKTGKLDKGIHLLEGQKVYAKRVGRGAIVECEYCLPLAKGYLAQGNIDKARANAGEALRTALEQGYALHEAQAHRVLGEIHAPIDFPSAADHFSRSLEIMQRIKARNEEGKTELSWGRACQRHGDMDQARAHLTRAAEIFGELGTERYLEWTREAMESLS